MSGRRTVLVTIVAAAVVGLPAAGRPGPEPWMLWSRDTQFSDGQPVKSWRTGQWAVRGGPFDAQEQCQRLMDEQLHSAARWLGAGYRVTSVVGSSLVARQVDRPGGLRRRYMCLPVSVAPPK